MNSPVSFSDLADPISAALEERGFCGRGDLTGPFYCTRIPHRDERHEYNSRLVLQQKGGDVLHIRLVQQGILRA